MKLYSYIVKHDRGFSPNPFWGYCTLANCKPAIRRTAEVGDWIVGLSPKASGNRVVFAMEVNEVLSYADYYRDSRFANKIPDFTKGEEIYKNGDNIYEPLKHGFRQLQSMHSKDKGKCEDHETKKRDARGVSVLISKKFSYFGASGPGLPPYLEELKVGRAHKNRFSDKIVRDFLKFISPYRRGVNALPTMWPAGDLSWQQNQG